mmetsp:Transcript_44299/g.96727  ORF Transcript_44299/g.96727 Transcript_44299/m.96727 type:complete len:162 (-) Transcript_44299:266-751(-)
MGANLCVDAKTNTDSENVVMADLPPAKAAVTEKPEEEAKAAEPAATPEPEAETVVETIAEKIEEAVEAAAVAVGLEKDMSKVLTFTVGGEEKEIEMTYGKPLGMTFDTQMPILIKSFTAGSNAEKSGVAKGMTLVKIAGKDITSTKYPEAFKELSAFIGKL